MTSIKQKLLEDFGTADNKELESAIDLILDKITSLGFVIVPVSQMIATDVADFEAVVLQWITLSADKLISEVSVVFSVMQIVQDLQQKGWSLIPPMGVSTYDIETTIRQHVNISIDKTDNLIDAADVPAEAIIQNLRQKGWFLLPPRS